MTTECHIHYTGHLQRLKLESYVSSHFIFYCRYKNGTGIKDASISVPLTSGKERKVVHSTEGGDYFRILLDGDYNMTVSVNDLSLTVPIQVYGEEAVVVNFFVTNDSSSIVAEFKDPPPFSAPLGKGRAYALHEILLTVLCCVGLMILCVIGLVLFMRYKKRKQTSVLHEMESAHNGKVAFVNNEDSKPLKS